MSVPAPKQPSESDFTSEERGTNVAKRSEFMRCVSRDSVFDPSASRPLHSLLREGTKRHTTFAGPKKRFAAADVLGLRRIDIFC